MGQLNYRLTIIESILNRYLYPLRKVKRGWLSDVLDPVHLKERHFSAYIQPSQAKAAPTRKRFICCRKQGKKGIKLKKILGFGAGAATSRSVPFPALKFVQKLPE